MNPLEMNRLEASMLTKELVAVIDIGSNSVKMVIYDGISRLPLPVFNEKVVCKLDSGLHATRHLANAKMMLALKTLSRFIILARNMGVNHIIAVATAAVRDAENGADFAARAEEVLGQPIQILSGEEEGLTSALGILSVFPKADGIVGDLGGGSLELAHLVNGEIQEVISLPLGHHRIIDISNDSFEKAAEWIHYYFKSIPWMADCQNKTFYAVGSRWRRIAEINMEQTQYPLHLVHHYTLPKEQLDQGLHYEKHFEPQLLGKTKKPLSAKLKPVVYAGLVLDGVLEHFRPSRLIFSGTSLRDGCLFKLLSPEERQWDPLLVFCEKMAIRNTWMPPNYLDVFQWIRQLVQQGGICSETLCRVGSMLTEISAVEPKDYKASLAFHRILSVDLPNISHPDRVFLALAIYVRYVGRLGKKDLLDPYLSLLSEEAMVRAEQLGLVLRLAELLSRGALHILPKTQLEKINGMLTLSIPTTYSVLLSDHVLEALKALAKALKCQSKILELERESSSFEWVRPS
ncbi:MAG: Ppx/GppA family phosphatase [Cyanobacteria bacterium]|nr:Ppx/GppA family phosphatase [Cyanobacteriota bacterium]